MKLSGLLLSGVLLTAAVPVNTFAEDEKTTVTTMVNGIAYTYRINDDGKTAELVSAAIPSSIKETAVPKVIDGYSITAVGEKAYIGSIALEKITIPSNVETLGKQAFMSCNELCEIVFEDGITVISDDCFFSCPKLVSVKFPDTLETIGSEAFFGCPELDVTIPDSVTSIGTDAFGMVAVSHEQGSAAVHGFLLKGTTGSCAEEYAKENKIDFIDMENYTQGDVNDSGSVDSVDASQVLIEYMFLSTGAPTSFTKKMNITADMNGDGVINSTDASQILIIYGDLSTGG